MNKANIDSHSIKFDRMLEFRHDPLNHKFNFEQQKKNFDEEARVCLLMLAGILTALLCALYEANWVLSQTTLYFACAFGALLIIAACTRIFESLRRFTNKALGVWVLLLCAGVLGQQQAGALH